MKERARESEVSGGMDESAEYSMWLTENGG
jgi:hypothetical protein